jgi:hypothetical protein
MDIPELGWGVWTELIWLRIRIIGGMCEYGNEHSASIMFWKFLDQLRNYQLLKKGSVP